MEITPPTIPIRILKIWVPSKLEYVPIMTPPANEALTISVIANFPSLHHVLMINAAIQEEVNDKFVVTMTLVYSKSTAIAALNDGQNIHKNVVPIMAKVNVVLFASFFL